jgi:hypothetical protein
VNSGLRRRLKQADEGLEFFGRRIRYDPIRDLSVAPREGLISLFDMFLERNGQRPCARHLHHANRMLSVRVDERGDGRQPDRRLAKEVGLGLAAPLGGRT